ncbi:DUF3419 family protein [Fimbriiglobus ruber]|uniref:S-adenosylmethionine:diacylglycerol 3-amino-3-carboxypropyl transferase n=1 Tax=Fimbriiglobus ruber TaxID=1908690 RepID=A0A225DBI1_9BACT|nr:DUF3419 family protein [Fimbriiglobus ruber]OWK34509.1 hypothetical protein FRUB_10480 [Fimbriiglobus ruber]
MSPLSQTWATEAARLPIAFAQVREDPLIDWWVADRLPAEARVVMVASGGCTAALLATHPNVAHLSVVDPNPAQLALTALKLSLLNDSPANRLAILGHAPMSMADRAAALISRLSGLGLPADALGPPPFVAEVGPDYAGRYERCFVALGDALKDVRDELAHVLSLSDPTEQARLVAPGTRLGDRLEVAFDNAFALPNLVTLFGLEATKNPVEPFARHFARRTRHVFATLPAADNPYLWQLLAGRYPDSARSPWLDLEPRSSPMPEFVRGSMASALQSETGRADFVHLSNILDWLTPDEARATLDLAAQALRPGGTVLIRQLNSTLDIPAAGSSFEWNVHDADLLHRRDRSFFYRALHLGRKR